MISFKLLQRERDSVKNQKSSFDSLIKELEDFHRIIHCSELGPPTSKRRRQSQSGGRSTRPLWYIMITLFDDSSAK